jgi:hypothetical protein
MSNLPNSSKPDRSEEAQRSPGRKVKVVAYLLLSVLWLGIPVLLFMIYGQTQDEKKAEYPKYKELMEFDPSREGGHLVPNVDILARGEHKRRGIRWVTNSKGFRNTTEFAYEVPDNTFRILLMGDSYVDGFRTDQERTIGYGLQIHLASSACKQGFGHYQVMLSGHNNPAAALYNYQEHGRKYDPRLVILGITVGNDITPRSYKKSLWPDRDPASDSNFKLVAGDRPAEQGAWKDLYLPNEAYTPKAPLRDHLLDIEFKLRDELAAEVPSLGYIVAPVIGRPPNERFHVRAGGNLTSLGLFYQPLLPEVEAWFRDFEEIILGMNRQVVSNGGKLLVVLFPTRAQVYARDWSLLERFYSLDGTKFRLDYPNNRILQFCRTNEIDCLDLLPGFKAFVQREGTHLYMKRGDMHFNEAGQALASDVISDHVCSSRDPMRTK